MGITVVPSAVTGQTYSAANYNTQVRDNINGIWVLTTAGDMLYATSGSSAGRLPLVTGGLMKGGASAPEWLLPGAGATILYSTGLAPDWATLKALAAISALVESQAGGDIIVANTATELGRVPKSTKGLILMQDDTYPSWESLIDERQGGSATNWASSGTTSQTLGPVKIKVGTAAGSLTSGTGTVTVTYDTEFVNRPIVWTQIDCGGERFTTRIENGSKTGFDVVVNTLDNATINFEIMWLAIGPGA